MIRWFAAYVFALFGLGALSVAAIAQNQAAAPAQSYEAMREKVNAWTVGLAAGLIEGAPLRLAAEMARVVDDGRTFSVPTVLVSYNWPKGNDRGRQGG